MFDILVLAALLLLSAVFSGMEIAFMSLSGAKVRELKEQKVAGSRKLEKLKRDPHKLLITILIGNNLVNIGASVYATVVFTDLFGSSGVGIATGVMTLLVLIFGEITPKTLAHKYRVPFALKMVWPVTLFQWLFYPVTLVLDGIIRLFNGKEDVVSGGEEVSEGEIKAMMDLGVEGGALDQNESDLIENILAFNDITVENVMTPRIKMETLEARNSLKEAADFVIKHTHSRIPVYKGEIDNILGYISVRDVLREIQAGTNVEKTLGEFKLNEILDVPFSLKINDLFENFREKAIHMAMVRDEFGGVLGLVTMEDLLEEIVGEIIDEYDREQDYILMEGERWIKVLGTTPVDVISDYFDDEFPADQYDLISSVVLETLSRFPDVNEEIEFEGYKVVVTKMKKNVILELKVEKL